MANYYTDYGIDGGPAVDATGVALRLHDFLVNIAGWTQLETFIGAVTTFRHRVYRSPARIALGTDYADIIVVEDTAAHALLLVGWAGASDPNHWDYPSAPGNLDYNDVGRPGHPGLYLVGASDISVNAGATNYWFFADAYRFMIITLAGAAYYTGYAGFTDAGYTSLHDPYPLLVKGGTGFASWTTEGAGCRMFTSANLPDNYSLGELSWNAGGAKLEAVQPDTRVVPNTYDGLGLLLGCTVAKELRGSPRGIIRISDDVPDEDVSQQPDSSRYLVIGDPGGFGAYGYGPGVP